MTTHFHHFISAIRSTGTNEEEGTLIVDEVANMHIQIRD
jgi:hypothetical protein